jgi:hypothetical protein
LNVPACRHAEIGKTHIGQLPGRIAYRPALDHAAGIDRPVRAGDVEIAIGFPPGFLAQGEDFPHAGRKIGFADLAAIETANFAVVLEGAELRIGRGKFREHRFQVPAADMFVRHSQRDGHAHDGARFSHRPKCPGPQMPLAACRRFRKSPRAHRPGQWPFRGLMRSIWRA